MRTRVHVIPRRKGDLRDPRGGIRWIIHGKANYWACLVVCADQNVTQIRRTPNWVWLQTKSPRRRVFHLVVSKTLKRAMRIIPDNPGAINSKRDEFSALLHSPIENFAKLREESAALEAS